MVLQREIEVPIWGKADAGAMVEVSFAEQRIKTQVDQTGNWRLKLRPMDASAESRVMSIRVLQGDKQVEHKIQDVLVGEVWLNGGQSNMYRPFRMLTGDANQKSHQPIVEYLRNEAATANDPLLRQFRSSKVLSVDQPKFKGRGAWSKAVPGDVNEFSGANLTNIAKRWMPGTQPNSRTNTKKRLNRGSKAKPKVKKSVVNRVGRRLRSLTSQSQAHSTTASSTQWLPTASVASFGTKAKATRATSRKNTATAWSP